MSSAKVTSERANLTSSRAWSNVGDLSLGLKRLLLRARSLYAGGAYAEVLNALGEINSTAQSEATPEAVSERSWLLAAALALEGRALLRLGRHDEARERCRSAVDQFDRFPAAAVPGSGDSASDYGIALYVCGERDVEARAQLTRGVTEGPSDAETCRFLGLTLMRLKLWAEAEHSLRDALRLAPGDIETLSALAQCLEQMPADRGRTAAAYFELAEVLFAAGRLDEALAACKTSLNLSPDTRAEAGVGTILGVLGHLDAALEAFDRALELDTSNSNARFKKGETLRLLGRPDEAIEVLLAIPSYAQEFAVALASVGASLAGLKKYEEALVTLDRALERDQTSKFAIEQKLDVLLALERQEEAIALCRRALSIEPPLTYVHLQLVDLLTQTGQSREALDIVEALIGRQPEVYQAYGLKGAALLHLKHLEEALEAFDRALALYPDFLFALRGKSTALAELKRHPEAIDVLRRVLDQEPNDVSSRYLLAESLRQLGRFEDALREIDAALTIRADSAELIGTKGQILAALSRREEAVDLLTRAVELNPLDWALSELGDSLRLLGRHEEALAAFNRVLGHSQDDPRALAQKLDVLLALERQEEAIALCRRALSIEPPLTYVHLQLVDLLTQTGQSREALDIVEALIGRQPEVYQAYALKGDALLRLERPLEALEAFDRALVLHPDSLLAQRGKGTALVQLKRNAEAIDVLRRVLDQEPNDVSFRYLLAESLRELGRFEDALREIDAALTITPDSAELIGTKGQILAALSRREEAVDLLTRAVELGAHDWVLFELGDSLRLLGRHEEALAAFDRILEHTPDDLRVLAWKGEELFNLQRYDEALAVFDRVLAKRPENVFAMATKGQVLAAQGRVADGVELLSRAVALDFEDARRAGKELSEPWARFPLAESLRILGRYEEALAVYDEILERQPNRVDVLGGKGSALVALERYDEALVALDAAIRFEPDYVFGIGTKGGLLTDCGEYEAAADLLSDVTRRQDVSEYELVVRGFACRVLRRYTEAVELLEHAVALDSKSLIARHTLGDVYRSMGEKAKSKTVYEAIIEESGRDPDPNVVAIVGWCYLGLKDFEHAVQCLVDAVSRGSMMAHVQFDLALAILCSGRVELARREYERGIELSIADHHPWRRRGLYSLALSDIADARDQCGEVFVDSEQVRSIEARLRFALDELPPGMLFVEAGGRRLEV